MSSIIFILIREGPKKRYQNLFPVPLPFQNQVLFSRKISKNHLFVSSLISLEPLGSPSGNFGASKSTERVVDSPTSDLKFEMESLQKYFKSFCNNSISNFRSDVGESTTLSVDVDAQKYPEGDPRGKVIYTKYSKQFK